MKSWMTNATLTWRWRSTERTAVLTHAFLAGLKSIVETTAQMSTDKTLILISDGFNLTPGQDRSYNERDTQNYLMTCCGLLKRQMLWWIRCIRAAFTRWFQAAPPTMRPAQDKET